MATPLTYQVDPLNSGYFGTSASGDSMANAGGYRDSALLGVLSQLNGAGSFYRANDNTGDTTNPYGVDPQLLQQYLSQQGYSIWDDPYEGGGTLRVMNGDQTLGSEKYENKDANFAIAAALMGAAGGSYLGAANGLGSVATGAMSGGAAAGMNDPSAESIGKGALLGAAAGGAKDYLTGSQAATGAQSSGNMLAGQYGAEGSLGDSSLLTGGTGGATLPLDFASVGGSGVGEGMLLAGQYGAAGSLGDPSMLTGATPATGSLSLLGNTPTSGSAPTTQADPASASPGGKPILDALTKDPKLTGAIVGGLLGGTDGGSGGGGSTPYTGPMPTITRGDWKPKAQANLMQVPQFGGGLLSGPGVVNSGLWRFKG